ncbi:hypothetical protein M0R72_09795 [Candidatus Pacearchaeota archaeon]|jgi:hypothetical protein|nr:hypothetical protein [Candidatus Pacearchaeota archaeon]
MLKKQGQTRTFSLYNFSKKNRRGALEVSFGWLFALIAGAVILFLAIYFSTKIIGTSDETISAETGKEITVLLNPLETSFETAQTTSITISSETRINNICEDISPFGKQALQLDQKRFNQWTKTDTDISSYNKYIFSEEQIEGKTFYLFSKPFDSPFKVANLIYLTSADDVYCFMNAPTEIKEEILNLNQENLIVDNCTKGSIKVCFSGGTCDITVDYSDGEVKKGGDIFYFYEVEDSNALMYAAIFSDKEIYECQVKRLMLRLKQLALIYYDKEIITREIGCEDNLGTSLIQLINLADDLNNSANLYLIKTKAEEVVIKNNARRCLLW